MWAETLTLEVYTGEERVILSGRNKGHGEPALALPHPIPSTQEGGGGRLLHPYTEGEGLLPCTQERGMAPVGTTYEKTLESEGHEGLLYRGLEATIRRWRQYYEKQELGNTHHEVSRQQCFFYNLEFGVIDFFLYVCLIFLLKFFIRSNRSKIT